MFHAIFVIFRVIFFIFHYNKLVTDGDTHIENQRNILVEYVEFMIFDFDFDFPILKTAYVLYLKIVKIDLQIS